MATKKNVLTLPEIIDSHKPKNFKYKFIIDDDAVYDELVKVGYDLATLDTIHNDQLVQAALKAEYVTYERTLLGKAKEPTIMEDGIIINKRMITKADKKLLAILIGRFDYNNMDHVAVRWRYEKFDIMEIFIIV